MALGTVLYVDDADDFRGIFKTHLAQPLGLSLIEYGNFLDAWNFIRRNSDFDVALLDAHFIENMTSEEKRIFEQTTQSELEYIIGQMDGDLSIELGKLGIPEYVRMEYEEETAEKINDPKLRLKFLAHSDFFSGFRLADEIKKVWPERPVIIAGAMGRRDYGCEIGLTLGVAITHSQIGFREGLTSEERSHGYCLAGLGRLLVKLMAKAKPETSKELTTRFAQEVEKYSRGVLWGREYIEREFLAPSYERENGLIGLWDVLDKTLWTSNPT